MHDTHTPISNIELPDPVTSLTATSVSLGIQFAVGLSLYLDANSIVQLYEYTANTPFASASLVAEFRGSAYFLSKADTTTRYYWAVIKNKATLQSSVEYPTSSNGISGSALDVTGVYSAYNPGVTGITVSGGGSAVDSITVTEAGKFEITVSGRMRRTAGAGGDSLTPTLNDSAGSGTFGGGRQITWNTTATGDSTALSMTAIYITSGSGPWTIDLNFLHGGGLATFAVDEIGMRLTVVRR